LLTIDFLSIGNLAADIYRVFNLMLKLFGQWLCSVWQVLF